MITNYQIPPDHSYEGVSDTLNRYFHGQTLLEEDLRETKLICAKLRSLPGQTENPLLHQIARNATEATTANYNRAEANSYILRQTHSYIEKPQLRALARHLNNICHLSKNRSEIAIDTIEMARVGRDVPDLAPRGVKTTKTGLSLTFIPQDSWVRGRYTFPNQRYTLPDRVTVSLSSPVPVKDVLKMKASFVFKYPAKTKTNTDAKVASLSNDRFFSWGFGNDLSAFEIQEKLLRGHILSAIHSFREAAIKFLNEYHTSHLGTGYVLEHLNAKYGPLQYTQENNGLPIPHAQSDITQHLVILVDERYENINNFRLEEIEKGKRWRLTLANPSRRPLSPIIVEAP